MLCGSVVIMLGRQTVDHMTVEIQGVFIISLIGEKVPQNW